MDKKVVVVCGAAGFLGLLSAVLGFAAEAKKIKASDTMTRIPGECIYPKSPALYLGFVSAASVALAQAVINIFAGCICCKRNTSRSNTNWTVALVTFAASWVTFVLAFLLLLTGVVLNDQKGMQKMYSGSRCYFVKPGVFSAGAVLSLASVSLGIIYYVALQAPKTLQPWHPPHNQGIALGQPQIPLQSNQPVFVHADTYNRQQLP